jgi:hypothetical protein
MVTLGEGETMDAQRFDNLARTLAGRFSRRGALRRAGAAASAGLLASAGMRSAAASALAQGDNADPVYTVIRRYTLNGQSQAVRRALEQGYVEDACRAKGFIAYFTVEDEDGDFVTIAVFRSQDDFEAFADDEAQWIAQNLANLLPSPDEAISGQSFIHAGSPQAFRDTCPGAPPEPTTSPAQPTTAAPTATAAPPTPTGTPAPPCTGEGCVCATGTRRPCDRGLVCCPTTDLLGGPGICKTREACNPNPCIENGGACPATCGGDDSCPGCCSNYCDANDQCADAPSPPCTGEGCDCATGTQGACDAGLVCCGTTNTPGGPGVCRTEAECNPPCTGEGCQCDFNDPSSCDPGLNCCAVQSGFICATQEQCPCTGQGCACNGGVQGNCDTGLVCCQDGQPIPGGAGTCQPEAQCAPPPCTGQGCDCNGGVQGACDDGLVCCQDGVAIPGGAGTCQPQDQCAPPPCTGEGCACNGGVQGACDPGLVCCQEGQAIPGGPGTCTTEANCAPPPCTGEGCDCNGGVQGACDAGLICCQTDPSVPGGPGTCQPAEACGPPPCTDIGGGCDATCNWGDSCPGCCTGYCNSTGQCDNAPSGSCTSEGCQCATGTLGACDDGLTCCSTSDDPGAPGVCQASC